MKRIALLTVFLLATAASAQREFGFDNTKPSGQPYLSAEETVKRMKVMDGFEVKLFASEPQVVNPIAFTIDEKGRIWVVESFEYPKRTPKGKMPRDRIIILEDTDGDGVCDSRKVFAEGKDFPMSFDMASGIEVGHGGVFLGAPPYLWFIENKNDKPGKFEVLLKGFGSQDTHETLNTFQWGPDGWLYGLHGVFTHSDVQQPEAQAPGSAPVKMNAAVWRYQPTAKKFEIFAEGTSNPWGMDWRNTDGEFILCCCVIPHLYHMVPGGIYKRQAGASFNPYAYGEIKEICDHTFHKESGWAHAGLISLDVPHMPKELQDSVIFGSIHGCSIKRNVLKRNGSTFTASRADDFLVSGDKNFRPINMKWGPNGDIFLIDWHDQNPCHQTKPDDWDYERGRVYRIQLKGTRTKKAEDLGSKNDGQVLELTKSANPYLARTADRLVRQRFAANPFPVVNTPRLGSWTDIRTIEALGNGKYIGPGVARDDAPIARAWGVRIWSQYAPPRNFGFSVSMAEREPDPVVRREYASAAIRLGSTQDVLPLIHTLASYKQDATDPLIPHLIWLAYEPRFAGALKDELTWLRENAPLNPLITDHIIPRVMRRLVATGNPEHIAACVHFLGDVQESAVRLRAVEGLVEAMKSQTFDAPKRWPSIYQSLLGDGDANVARLARTLAVSFRDPEAMKRAFDIARDLKQSPEERVEAIRQVTLMRHPEALPTLLAMTRNDQSLPVRVEAMRGLGSLNQPSIAREVIEYWSKYPTEVRVEAANVLAGRREWAKPLLDAMGEKKIARTDLTDNTILRIRSFNDRNLNGLIEKVWGRFRPTPKELDELINKTRASLYEAPGSFARGKAVFETTCGKCHKFEGKGAEVGPALDGAARDIEYLLANVLDPNRVIGQPYFVHVIERKNGANEIGLLAAEDPNSITLKVEQGILKVIAKKDIESHTVQEKSMMPEGLDKSLNAQSFRDLVRYAMAHPFITQVKRDGKDLAVGVPGRIPLPEAKDTGESTIDAEVTSPIRFKTRLLLGGSGDLRVKLNGKVVYTGRPGVDGPDGVGADVELIDGVNKLVIEAKYKGIRAAVYARFLDPDRKLRYPEPK